MSELIEKMEAERSQVDLALSAAARAAASHSSEHEEEVACLSEKLRQLTAEQAVLLDERAVLQALCSQQATDLEVLSAFLARQQHGEA